ncbi:hypothetical protein CDAR_604591 [Caerostris darwini]|uniref:PiggyBac transposable element-derived protein domain-containing protein n=1 Tax=Caerostris darwini TaxID=1538125 RepID=A0AAV4MWC2_9ARAC|nr:hypothetical protein CDAR_604591 [Caerostris darwini]
MLDFMRPTDDVLDSPGPYNNMETNFFLSLSKVLNAYTMDSGPNAQCKIVRNRNIVNTLFFQVGRMTIKRWHTTQLLTNADEDVPRLLKFRLTMHIS